MRLNYVPKNLTLKYKTHHLKSLFLISIFCLLLFSVKGGFLHRVYAEPSIHKSVSAPVIDVSLAKTPLLAKITRKDAIADASSDIKIPMLEIHVANTGAILLRGAKVTSIEANIIHVTTTWNEANLSWSVKTKFFTTFLTNKGKKAVLSDIKVGDTLTITGKLMTGGTEPTIEAEFIRK